MCKRGKNQKHATKFRTATNIVTSRACRESANRYKKNRKWMYLRMIIRQKRSETIRVRDSIASHSCKRLTDRVTADEVVGSLEQQV